MPRNLLVVGMFDGEFMRPNGFAAAFLPQWTAFRIFADRHLTQLFGTRTLGNILARSLPQLLFRGRNEEIYKR
jgi:hypothetical protein